MVFSALIYHTSSYCPSPSQFFKAFRLIPLVFDTFLYLSIELSYSVVSNGKPCI